MRITPPILVGFLAAQVILTMSDETYDQLTKGDGCFNWFHTYWERSPVYGKSDSEKLAYCMDQVIGIASFGRVKSLEERGITVEVNR